MINHGNEIKIFSGNSNRPLAEAIAAKLNTTLGDMEVTHFSDLFLGRRNLRPLCRNNPRYGCVPCSVYKLPRQYQSYGASHYD